MGTSLGYLTNLYSSGTDATGSTSLLSSLYGFASSAKTSGGNPISALRLAERNQTQYVKATTAQPAVQRAIKAFTSAVTGAKTVQQLLTNPAVMSVLLTANGLADQIPYTALARKTFQSNVNDPKSLANTLSDTRWKPAVKTYDFANKGLSVIQDPKVISTLANAYAEVTWRKSLDTTTPGLSNALSFRAEAKGIKSVYQILGDPVLRKVITVALGIPLQIAFQSLEAQERSISTRVDITKFQDPKFVDTFVQRYLIAQANSTSGDSTATGMTTLAIQAQGGLTV